MKTAVALELFRLLGFVQVVAGRLGLNPADGKVGGLLLQPGLKVGVTDFDVAVLGEDIEFGVERFQQEFESRVVAALGRTGPKVLLDFFLIRFEWHWGGL